MLESRPSLTAERVAVRRAAHQLLDVPPVFVDPLAVAILGEARARELRADPGRRETGLFGQRLRAFLAARCRIAEEALREAVGGGVRQYVVLGAGLDTFACRNPYPGVRVFEVDHPATQGWKRQRLDDARIPVPESVTFVAVDFASATEPLPAILEAAGLRARDPSFFSWLGVTQYLSPGTVRATLRAIAPLAAGGGGVAFDYTVSPESLGPRQRAAHQALAARVAAAGEPFVSWFDPRALVAEVSGMGYSPVRDLGPEEINAAYFAGRSDGLQVGGSGRILVASR